MTWKQAKPTVSGVLHIVLLVMLIAYSIIGIQLFAPKQEGLFTENATGAVVSAIAQAGGK